MNKKRRRKRKRKRNLPRGGRRKSLNPNLPQKSSLKVGNANQREMRNRRNWMTTRSPK